MKHRLFFAIEFHDEVKRELYEHADKYAGQIGLRVTTPGHLHITLRFLGDTDEALVPELTGEKMDFLSELVGLKCKFTNFGFFTTTGCHQYSSSTVRFQNSYLILHRDWRIY